MTTLLAMILSLKRKGVIKMKQAMISFLMIALSGCAFLSATPKNLDDVKIQVTKQEATRIPGYFHMQYAVFSDRRPENSCTVDYYGQLFDVNDDKVKALELRKCGLRPDGDESDDHGDKDRGDDEE